MSHGIAQLQAAMNGAFPAHMAQVGMRIPICWKCESAITGPSSGRGQSFLGCKAEESIKSYSDAQKRCPLKKRKHKG